jgi:two-component system NarL family sensor kinase
VEGAHKRIFVFWGAVLTLAVVGLIITEGLRVRAEEGLHEVNEILERQAAELEKHRSHLEELVSDRTTEVETLSERLIEAQEEERKRVSMELHDALGQALNAVKLQVRVIERELGPSQVEAKEYCDRLMSYLDDTIENVRRLSLNLSPTILEDLGLSSALQWLVKDFESADGMKVTALIDEIDSYLPKNKWITLYRIVQESLNNVERHAEASNVTVAVERDGDTVSVRIEDDGKGFDVGKPADSEEIGRPGMGLRTIQERISSMGGDMIFESAHNQGTRVAFRVPVANGVA